MTKTKQYLEVRNFSKFQHYKERNPPWIKIHRSIFQDYEFSCLQDASKLHLMLIWVMASQCENRFPNDAEWVKNQIGVKGEVDLQILIKEGFLTLIADCKQDASTLPANADSEAEAYKPTEAEANLLQGKKQKGKKYDEGDLAFAKKMAVDIGSWSSSFKTPAIEEWAEEIRKIREIDKRPPEQIKQTWKAIQADSPMHHNNGNSWKGWRSVILSPKKLRKQYHNVRTKLNLDNVSQLHTLEDGKRPFVGA